MVPFLAIFGEKIASFCKLSEIKNVHENGFRANVNHLGGIPLHFS